MGNEQLPELPSLNNFSQPQPQQAHSLQSQAPATAQASVGTSFAPPTMPDINEPAEPPRDKKKTSIGLIAAIIAAVVVLAIAVPVGLFICFNSLPKFPLNSRNEIASAAIMSPTVKKDGCWTEGSTSPISYFGDEAEARSGTFKSDLEATEQLIETLYPSDSHTERVISKLEPYSIEAASEGGTTEIVEFALYRVDTIDSSSFVTLRAFDASGQAVVFKYTCRPGEGANYGDFLNAFESANLSVFTGK
ncbi:hypothetical protein [Gulosibacter hominis]|uniref:hypothetical protein n=1 Tax=Gulosibacter hominis TaxID=2770504 RepID=UPI001918B717|nr:hypothetical protein [Gulosibacter hominis]